MTGQQVHKFYGIDRPESDPRERPVFWPPNTQLFSTAAQGQPGENTRLVTDLLEIWQDIPAPLTREIDTRRLLIGYIGGSDRTMAPLLPPGTYLQIDPKRNRVKKEAPQTEAEPSLRGRAIYFLDIRTGYACGWCEVKNGILTLVPHPHSGEQTRTFRYPHEAEVVGQVTAIVFLPIVEDKTKGKEGEK